VRRQPAQVDSGLCRCPRAVVPTWWEWNERSGSEELTGSPGGYLEPFPRSGTTISVRPAAPTTSPGMLHDRNTAPRDVAVMFRLHPPRKCASLLALLHTTRSGSIPSR
jgi:hypothetical protein